MKKGKRKDEKLCKMHHCSLAINGFHKFHEFHCNVCLAWLLAPPQLYAVTVADACH